MGSIGQSFDQLSCNVDLMPWKTSLNDQNKSDKTISNKIKSKKLKFKQSESQTIEIIDENKKLVANVFPWNTAYVRVSSSYKDKVKAELSENDNSFQVKFIDLKKKVSAKWLDCVFSF